MAVVAEALRWDPSVSAVLAVLPTPVALEQFRRDLLTVCADGYGVRDYPMLDMAEDDPEAVAARLSVLTCLTARADARVVVATCVQAMLQPSPDPCCLERASLCLATGDAAGLEALVDWLSQTGYRREPEVFEMHTFAVKGGIVDVWPSASRHAVRIEFFGDDVASLRAFTVFDQRSTHPLEAVKIPPTQLSGQARVQVHARLPDGCVVLWIGHEELAHEAEAFAAGVDLPETERLPAVRASLANRSRLREVFIGDPRPPGVPSTVLPFDVVDSLQGADARHHDPDFLAMRRRHVTETCVRLCERARIRLQVCLDTPAMVSHFAREFTDRSFDLRASPLSGGFVVCEADGRPMACLLGQADLYGRAKRPRMRSVEASPEADALAAVPSPGAFDGVLADLDPIVPGDHVVHVEYGIGRFVGTREMALGGRLCEVFCVAYADDTRLFMPVSQAHLLSRYKGVGDGPIRLHRLGGRRWIGEKTSARHAVEHLALRMLETQARRKQLTGFAFAENTPYLHEFEAAFPYAETPGQQACIDQVKRDMISTHPMDRLVCGDAGYGKTEVAVRAAFICAMQGRQVAVLVPTTVLAQQHYDTFCDRLAAYPLILAVHSRFCSRAQRDAALAGVAAGTVDILIGTHGILRPGVRFKDLGLVIIDEEQRFGVRHKEYLKSVRLMVDVLTLSATPIPRTLHLGLMGVRDLSLLQTPPRERVAVETHVVRTSDAVVRQAILTEINRGGQVFYVHNRVMTIGRVAGHLAQLLPHIRIGVGHGQMPASEIEAVMHDFSAGRYDVLLCTTIIESGIDIPRANTILIDRADRFGLADLYQLRGRVGRGGVRAHAYFLLPSDVVVADDARERLKALQQHAGLGAGVGLAMRDLSIRGAGNLLGAEQSGHLSAVGFNLYGQLLRRAIARLRGEPLPMPVDVTVSLPFVTFLPSASSAGNAACLPYDYLDEEARRVAFHRALAECVSAADLEVVRRDTADRFGRFPPALDRLFAVAEIRLLAATGGIQRVEVDDAGELRLTRANRASSRSTETPVFLRARSADARLAEIAERLRECVCAGDRTDGGNPARATPGAQTDGMHEE